MLRDCRIAMLPTLSNTVSNSLIFRKNFISASCIYDRTLSFINEDSRPLIRMTTDINLNTESWAFLDGLRFKTTEWCKARITNFLARFFFLLPAAIQNHFFRQQPSTADETVSIWNNNHSIPSVFGNLWKLSELWCHAWYKLFSYILVRLGFPFHLGDHTRFSRLLYGQGFEIFRVQTTKWWSVDDSALVSLEHPQTNLTKQR